MLKLNFTHDDACRAAEEWGCNCGPSALAAVLHCSLDDVRQHLGDFETKRYMSPTTMKDALRSAGVGVRELTKGRKFPPSICPACFPHHGLVRIQWTGPWTKAGANPRWAYGYTHWIATYACYAEAEDVQPDPRWFIFDINCGLQEYEYWESEIPKVITAQIKRADGGWYATHLWQVDDEFDRAIKKGLLLNDEC